MTTPAAPALARRYSHLIRFRILCLALLAMAVVASFLFDLTTGPSLFPLEALLGGLFAPSSLDVSQSVILWNVRLPQAVMALLVGGSLGLAGAEMQTVLNNPLASPFTLGVSAAATLGAAMAIAFSIELSGISATYTVPSLAFVFAAAAMLLIQPLVRSYGASTDTVVLFGIAILFTCEALVWLIQFLADADQLQQIVFWSMGSLTRTTWDKIAVVAVVLVVVLPWSMRQAWSLTTLRAGEDQARSVGIPVERLRMLSLLRASMLAAVAVSFVGTIGFVGLIGPHVARLALGEDHRFYLPGSALAGAFILSLASIASKSIIPGLVVPIGIVTALTGIPVFLALVLARRRG
ncbi:FecCD family ABC transporter permease [Rhodoligotrophos defluvii]|uniref:FecCD family ABC transporter permease n=1 Tax=Rhodoligotrophos defluvii TaxID=2561934 RepID=UPI0010C9A215|nr:iron ABC transporter permease [Rhodoligotrophos defluvii]